MVFASREQHNPSHGGLSIMAGNQRVQSSAKLMDGQNAGKIHMGPGLCSLLGSSSAVSALLTLCNAHPLAHLLQFI